MIFWYAKQNITIIMIIALTKSVLKTVYKHVKLSTNMYKHCKTFHDKCQLSQYYIQLLLVMIIVSSEKLHDIDYWQRKYHD